MFDLTGEKISAKKCDELFEAMLDGLAIDAASMTRSERGRINAALGELREVNATPQELRAKIKEYRRRWPNCSCTATAIAGNWSALASANAISTGKAEKILQNLLAEHQRGSNRRYEVGKLMARLTHAQRGDAAIKQLVDRFDQPLLRIA